MTPLAITGSRRQIARALKGLRLERGLSHGQLARRLSVSRSLVIKRESGHRGLHLEDLIDTARVFGYRVTLQPTAAAQRTTWPTGTGWPT